MLVGGRVTVEDAYAYAKFARIVLGTNDIDFRAREHSGEEAQFLAARIAGRLLSVTYADLDRAPAVLLVGFEPEEESPIVFLRLRLAARGGAAIRSIAPFASRGLTKMSGRLVQAVPGSEAAVLDGIRSGEQGGDVSDLLRRPGAVKRLAPQEVGTLEQGDVVLLLGVPELLAAAEIRLLQG